MYAQYVLMSHSNYRCAAVSPVSHAASQHYPALELNVEPPAPVEHHRVVTAFWYAFSSPVGAY